MNSEVWELYFADEAPRIGSGKKFVRAKIGRKWVHLASRHSSGKQRIRRTVWDQLVANRFSKRYLTEMEEAR